MAKFNTPHAHSDKWHLLDNLATIKLFKVAFGEEVAILPGQYVIEQLRELGTATIELLEDRTSSSVYRIRQTGVVYQVECMEGRTFDFEDYDDYVSSDPIDTSVTAYSTGELPNYTVVRVDADTLFVTRNNTPRFCCTYKNDDTQFTEIKDSIEPEKAAKLMRSMSAVISRFLKDEQQKTKN